MHRVRLDNGLQLIVAPSSTSAVVALQAWVGVGAADEPRGQAGIAHLVEHMLFKGSSAYPVGKMARTVESAGGEINAWTSLDHTVLHLVLGSRHFETSVDLIADALQRPNLDREELEREREVVLEEIRQNADDPMRLIARSLFASAFSRHPYGRSVIGEPEVVRSLGTKELRKFMSRWYVANNITLVIAGDVLADEAERVVRASFSAMPSRELGRRRQREPKQAAARVTVHTRATAETKVVVGFHVPVLAQEQSAAMDLAAIVLGQGDSSRLATRVQRQQRLVTSAHAYCHTMVDHALFVVSATLQPESLHEALRALAREIATLSIETPTSAELDKARHSMRADAIYQRETTDGVARTIAYHHAMAGDAEFESEILREIHRLRSSDVGAAAEQFLVCENATMVVMMPESTKLVDAAARDREALALRDSLAAGFTSVMPRVPCRRLRPRERGDLVRDVLPNGVRVIVKHDATVPVVALRSVWPGGLRFERVRSAGMTNLLARAITCGCAEASASRLVELVDDLAGVIAGVSGRNSFGLCSEWLSTDWERGFDLMSSCLRAPSFEDDEVERQKSRIVEALESRAESAAFVAFRNFTELLFEGHPYRFSMADNRGSIEAVTRRRIRDFYRRNYPIGAMTLAVVGDADPDRVFECVAARLGDVTSAALTARSISKGAAARGGTSARNVVAFMDREQAHVVIGFPGIEITDADRPALEVLMSILGGQGGRLFLELRDRQALAYKVSAYSVEGVDPGYIATHIACAQDKLELAVAALTEQLERVACEPVCRTEVDRAARYLVGSHEIGMQRRSALASTIALDEAYGVGHDHYLRYASEIAMVTEADVARVARRLLRWEASVTSIVRAEETRA